MLSQSLRRRVSSKTILPEYNSHPWQTSDDYTILSVNRHKGKASTKHHLKPQQNSLESHLQIPPLCSPSEHAGLFERWVSFVWVVTELSCNNDKESYAASPGQCRLSHELGFRFLPPKYWGRIKNVPSDEVALLTGPSIMEQHSFSDAGLLIRLR